MPVRSFAKAEIVLKARRRLEVPLLLMVWLSLAMFAIADQSPTFVLAATAVAGGNLVAATRGKEIFLYRHFVNALVLGGGLLFIIESLNDESLATLSAGGLPLRAITHFIMVIQMCKLLERKRNRDYSQMLILSFLTVLSGSLICELLWYGLAGLVYVALACYVGMALTIKRGLDRSAQTQLINEATPPPTDQVAWNAIREWPSRVLRRRLVTTLAFLLVCGTLWFTAAPRLEQVMEPLAARGLSALTGLGSTVRLGDARKVYQSNRVVMRIGFDDDAAYRPQYFCAATATTYENSGWAIDLPAVGAGPQSEIAPPPDLLAGAVRQRVSMRPNLLPSLPAAYPVIGATTSAGRTRLTRAGTLIVSGEIVHSGHLTYTAWSWSQPLSTNQREHLARRREQIGMAVDLPNVTEHLSPAVAQLARQWCADLLDQRAADPTRHDELDLAIARRISQRLSQDYLYTLDLSGADPDRDGVEDFLFHMKRGHCEYFASALTVMCQALNVRARLAMGFRSDEIDRATRETIVRDRDAHAWCQVFTPSTDFVTVDPSPASARESASGSWWVRLSHFWSRLQFLWSEHVIGYDALARQRLTERLRRNLTALVAQARSMLADARKSLHDLAVYGKVDVFIMRLMYVVFALTGVVGVLVLGQVLLRRHRRQRAYRAGTAVPPAHLAFMRRVLKRLDARGLAHLPHQTPRERLAQAVRRFDLPADQVDALVSFYYRLRWGGLRASAQQLAHADRQADDLIARLQR